MHCPRAVGGNTCIVSEVIGCFQITAQYRRKRVLRVRSRPYKMVRVNVTCLLSFVMINRSVTVTASSTNSYSMTVDWLKYSIAFYDGW